MAVKNKLKYGTILKRSSCLRAINESTSVDSQKLFNNLENQLNISKNGMEAGVQEALKLYIESMCNVENASEYYWQPFSIISSFNSKHQAFGDRIVNEYNTRILPYVADMNSVKEYLKYNDTLLDSQKESVLEFTSLYEAIDRILNNHNMISKRFNIENEAKRYKTIGLKYIVDNCAMMVDTYNIKPHQKLNVTIEEVSYLLNKNGDIYDKKQLVEYALQYFLLQNPYITESEISSFQKVLKESFILSENDCSSVSFVYNKNINVTGILSMIQKFLLSDNKTSIDSDIKDILSRTTFEDVLNNMDKLINLLWDLMKYKIFESDDIIFKALDNINDYISNIINDPNTNINQLEISTLMDTINNIKTDIINFGNINSTLSKSAVDFCNYIDNGLKKTLQDSYNLVYDKYNIENINYLNSESESIPLAEFKVFKFHNLVNASFNLNKFLKVKEKKLFSKLTKNITKVRNKLTDILFEDNCELDSINPCTYIGTDNKADICVRQYIYNESDIVEIKNFLSSVCTEYNDLLVSQNKNTIKSYYIINPGIAEIRIKESYSVELTESEKQSILCIDPATETYFNTLIENDLMLSEFEDCSKTLVESISGSKNYSKFDVKIMEMIAETLSYITNDKSILKLLGEKFIDSKFSEAVDKGIINESYLNLANQETKINNIIENWNAKDNVPIDIQLEAYSYFNYLMESAADYWDDDEEDDEEYSKKDEKKSAKEPEEKKEEKLKDPKDNPNAKDVEGGYKPSRSRKKISLNGIKLGLKGLQTKFKDMNTKQKEMSKNLDNSIRALVKGMKDSMVSDRREAIIKGSIIPSFSRCLKNGAALAILGIASGNIVVPVIAAIGGLAMSKKLTKKERLLLLDEIETELEVVDKEIQMADSNNQINKYRALLQYKKELQRQYQRIRYNIRVGKDILPDSSNGVPKNN